MALGIVVICKASGIFNLAVGEFVAFGCYLGWALLIQVGLSLPVMIIMLFVVITLLAFSVERFFMRPLIGQPVLSAIMITIALMEILAGVITLLWPGIGRMYPPILPAGTWSFWGVTIAQGRLIIFIVCMLVFGLFVVFFQRTRIGLVMRAASEDQQLAQSGGVKVTRITAVTWFIGITTCFIGGILLGMLQTVNPGIAGLGMKAYPAVIVGGLESVPGALLGGLLIGLSESLGAGYLDKFVQGGMAEVMPFVVLMLVLIIKPYGLFGYKRIERV